MASAAPLPLINAIVRIAKARRAASSAMGAVNQLHSKASRTLPATDAERLRVVEELDAAYLAAIKAAEQEREASQLCLRTIEEISASRAGAGAGRIARGRPEVDDEQADADARRQKIRYGQLPSSAKPEGGSAAHPYGRAPGWGDDDGPSDTGDNQSEFDESAAGDGEEGEEEEQDAAAAGKGLPELGGDDGVDDEAELVGELGSDLASDMGGDDAGSEVPGDEEGSEMAMDDGEEGDEDDDGGYGEDDEGEDGDDFDGASDSNAPGEDDDDDGGGEDEDGDFGEEGEDGEDDGDSSAMGE